MKSRIERLLSCRVRDVMSTDVVTVPDDSTLAEAADILRDFSVTGVPVTDGMGHCVGVLSATDFVNSRLEDFSDERLSSSDTATQVKSRKLAAEPSEMVRTYMSTNVQTVPEHVSAIEAGREMCHEHIHRLIVLDRNRRPVGIVSSLDIVSALINAVED